MGSDGVCGGVLLTRVCSRDSCGECQFLQQFFISKFFWFCVFAFLASNYGARQSLLASGQTQSEWQGGLFAPKLLRGIHFSVNGRSWRRSEEQSLASHQGQMFCALCCHLSRQKSTSRARQTSALELLQSHDPLLSSFKKPQWLPLCFLASFLSLLAFGTERTVPIP